MSIDSYISLQAAIADTLNRDDIAGSIPTFIALGEASIERDVRHWSMEKRTTAAVAGRYTNLPSDFLEPISVYMDGANRDLEPMSRGEMQDNRQKSADAVADPLGYHITAGQLELWPTPSTGTVEFLYFGTLPRLSASVTSNVILARAADIYLYGSLIHTAPYLREDARLPVWASLYQAAVDALNGNSDRAKFGGGSLRIR